MRDSAIGLPPKESEETDDCPNDDTGRCEEPSSVVLSNCSLTIRSRACDDVRFEFTNKN